jgi:hypothetical protein
MDMSWKRHERETAEFFGTRRALHGIDRVQGEVQTDVFVDGAEWDGTKECSIKRDFAFIIECKYTSNGASSNSWMMQELACLSKEPAVKSQGLLPILVTRDNWHWVQIDNFQKYLRYPLFTDLSIVNTLEVRHKNKEMSMFFVDAIEQAKMAMIPGRDIPFTYRFHAVCVGSNARLPKCIGVPPKALVKLA